MNFSKVLKDFWWKISAYKTIDTMPDSIIFVDFNGFIVKHNSKAANIFALTNDSDNIMLNIDDIIKDGLNVIIESTEKLRPILTSGFIHGKEFYVEVNASKKFGGYCVSIRDLTKLTDELVNDDKIAKFNGEKNAMLAKLESDIKSPITSISGFSKGLLDGLGGELTEKQAKYVKIISNNAEELHNFMNDLLEFSKVESSIYEPDVHIFDVVELLKSVTKDIDEKFPDKQFSFEYDFSNIDKHNICMDSFALKTIFKNILEVSISMTETGFVFAKAEYISEENCLKFGINPENKEFYLHITIADSGSGIGEDEIKFLCEPYAQLEKGKKNFTRALKLGTATILIKRLDGLFDVSSEVMNGAKYDIILPILKDKDEQSNT
jgi:signal transduction histidine kinase